MYAKCDSCGDVGVKLAEVSRYLHNTSIPPKFSNKNLCVACLAKQNFTLIHRWNYTPPMMNFLGKDTKLFMGLELELCYKDNSTTQKAVREVSKTFNIRELHAMYDGSIGEGVEFTTHPMSFDYINSVFKKKADALFKVAPVASDRCGMHIHLSQDAFTRGHLLRFVNMIHDHDDLIQRVARRLNAEHCSKPEKKRLIDMVDGKTTGNHHNQVNMTSGKTIEIRIFAGVTTLEETMKNVEFCHALYEFTRTAGAVDCTDKKFEEYVNKHSKTYAALASWLKTH
jgi:hypothetical protein